METESDYASSASEDWDLLTVQEKMNKMRANRLKHDANVKLLAQIAEVNHKFPDVKVTSDGVTIVPSSTERYVHVSAIMSEQWTRFTDKQKWLRLVFLPDKFCCCFNVNYIEQYTRKDEFIRFCCDNPSQLNEFQLTLLCRYLTITSNKLEYDRLNALVHRSLECHRFVLKWDVLLEILVNMGLTPSQYQFSPSVCRVKASDTEQPFEWNWQSLLMLIRRSYRMFPPSSLTVLVKFLADCLFDFQLLPTQNEVSSLLREVLTLLLKSGNDLCTIDNVVGLIDQHHVSMVCSWHMILHLNCDAELSDITTRLINEFALKLVSIYTDSTDISLSGVATVLTSIVETNESVTLEFAYHMLGLCEILLYRNWNDANRDQFFTTVPHFADYCLRVFDRSIEKYTISSVTRRLQIVCTLPYIIRSEPLSVEHCPNVPVNVMVGKVCRLFVLNDYKCLCKYCGNVKSRDSIPHTVHPNLASCISCDLCTKGFYDSAIAAMAVYTVQSVMMNSSFIRALVSGLDSIVDACDSNHVKSFLQRHLECHPPCLPGMDIYYLDVFFGDEFVGEDAFRDMNTKTNLFISLISKLASAFEDFHSPPPDEHSIFNHHNYSFVKDALHSKFGVKLRDVDPLVRIERLMCAFKYYVDILEHNFYASVPIDKNPLIVTIVWGSCDKVNLGSHCTDIVDLFMKSPSFARHDVGRYLTLLAAVFQKSDTDPSIDDQIGSNQFSEFFAANLLSRYCTSTHKEALDSIPSTAFREQIRRRLQNVL